MPGQGLGAWEGNEAEVLGVAQAKLQSTQAVKYQARDWLGGWASAQAKLQSIQAGKYQAIGTGQPAKQWQRRRTI